jgi:hypothetical protein
VTSQDQQAEKTTHAARAIPTVSNQAGGYVEEGAPRLNVQTIRGAWVALARPGLR